MEGNNNISINVAQGDGNDGKGNALVKTARLAFKSISATKWKSIFKVWTVCLMFFALGIVSSFLYNASKSDDVIKEAANKLSLAQKGENLRDFVVTPKIQKELSTLVYLLNADRAFLFELHNGKQNASGLPFRFADMTYEETNEDKKIDKVARNFQDIPLTLYKYPHYLQKEKVMMGTVDEISSIDREFANHIRSCNGEYLAMIYLNDDGNPLGFLCVSFHDTKSMPSKEVIRHKLEEYSKSITQLLDFSIQMNGNKKMFEGK